MKRPCLFALCVAILAAACSAWSVRGPTKRERIATAVPARQSENGEPTWVDALSAVEASTPKRVALRECSLQLERGKTWLKTVTDYTAVFRKQERVGDVLRAPDTIDLKLRQHPFSVAMTWRDNGRVVYYREGTNGNRITVRMGGWKRRLGWIHLDPHATLAMAEARYPVTDVGLMRLTEQLLERFAPYLDNVDGVTCRQEADEPVGDRLCRVFSVEYRSTEVNPDYRRTIVWLDAERSIPLAVQNFDWDTTDPLNPDGLVEHYSYEELHFNRGLVEADFSVDGQTADPAVAMGPRRAARTEGL